MNEEKYELLTEEDAFKELGKREKEAKEILEDENKTMVFLKALEKIAGNLPEKFAVFKNVPIMGEMVYRYIKKEYRVVPVGTMISIVAGLLYLLKHNDLIPDKIPIIGRVDDALVLRVAVKSAKHDIDKFIKWREENENSNN